ncbi:Glycosyl transferases group 1 [Flavobacterium swingsii]|uniref:Glycosyl transferases group 1 n=1 Tax=Flavobacterium swingsii TaxID=498292 RepID=A0A1I0Z9B3_9FLAO|nr:glycosyltransferase [Flavobacterium swingsii]SFB21018.1 Glycosyl transferases group 1 [Flavobacterium swingsii]
MNNKRIFFVCDDINAPTGGIKQIYRQVDILNNNGFNAFVLHRWYGFKCTWFKNETKIAYYYPLFEGIDNLLKTKSNEKGILNLLLKAKNIYKKNIKENLLKIKSKSKNISVKQDDIFVFPEVYGPNVTNLLVNNPTVIYNQGAYQTFFHYDLNLKNNDTPYLEKNLIATVVNSENAKEYINHAFPKMTVNRVRYGIDAKNFSFNENKKRKIAFMPRRLRPDLVQVINILKFRGVLENWELVEIHNMNENEVAKNLKECAFFLSFSINEGFGMPPAEAMACGCVVVGYAGKGGKEFFKEDFCYPIEDRDVIAFAKTLEKVIKEYELDDKPFVTKGKKASEFILSEYSMEMEERTIVECWTKILN